MPKDKPLELVRIPLSQIKPDPKNAKDHDVGLIIESFRRFGYVNPMVLNADDFLLAGHGRRKALLAMQGDGDSPPKNIEAKDDEWIVPVGIGPDFDQGEGTAYRLVDNRSTEVGGYDEPQLLENLIALSKNGGLEATGYDLEDVDRLFQLLNPNLEEVAVSDEAKKLQRKWKTKSGQLWEIGRHRLLCGDSTSEENVGRLMDGQMADAVLTDPPYGMNLNTDFSKLPRTPIAGKVKRYTPVIGDDKPFDIRNVKGCDAKEQFWWGGDWYYECLPPNGSWIVWDKRTEDSDKLIGNTFEMCWSKKKHRREFIRHYWKGVVNKDVGETERYHPAQKPSPVIEFILQKYTKKNEIIYDPFLGSGTTMVAAEQLNRICYGMEIEPKYVAVTLERMSTMGLEPKLLNSATL